jgi:hypothetical protein
MAYRSTREVAKLLGLNPSRLARALWDGRLTPPARAPAGGFLWTVDDVERASWLLRRRSADDVLDGKEEQHEKR